jgi:hypothetical protein
MSHTLIRYRVKPGQSSVNTALVQAVYAELRETAPDDLSYATFRLPDEVTFLHLVSTRQSPSPLVEVRAFQDFQAGVAERCAEQPVRDALTVIGSYRFSFPG